jgi:hypothetical protein
MPYGEASRALTSVDVDEKGYTDYKKTEGRSATPSAGHDQTAGEDESKALSERENGSNAVKRCWLRVEALQRHQQETEQDECHGGSSKSDHYRAN